MMDSDLERVEAGSTIAEFSELSKGETKRLGHFAAN